MKYNTAEIPQAGKVKLQLLSRRCSTDDHESRSNIINATIPASAANGDIFQILNPSNLR